MKRVIAAVILSLLAVCIISSCTAAPVSEEQKEEYEKIAGELIEKSYEINEVFFGKGLPHVEDEEEDADPEEYDVKPVRYLNVVSEKYKDIDGIKEAAESVYTESFLKNVYDVAFEGFFNGDELVEYAVYIMNFRDELCIRSDFDLTSLTSGRTYDLSTVKVTKSARNYVYFTVVAKADGKEDETVTLSMKDEGRGWRLDSPTY